MIERQETIKWEEVDEYEYAGEDLEAIRAEILHEASTQVYRSVNKPITNADAEFSFGHSMLSYRFASDRENDIPHWDKEIIEGFSLVLNAMDNLVKYNILSYDSVLLTELRKKLTRLIKLITAYQNRAVAIEAAELEITEKVTLFSISNSIRQVLSEDNKKKKLHLGKLLELRAHIEEIISKPFDYETPQNLEPENIYYIPSPIQ